MEHQMNLFNTTPEKWLSASVYGNSQLGHIQ